MSFEFFNPFSSRCPQCRSWVRKGAQHCNNCGSPRKGSWKKCTGCGESVGADSKHCWNCTSDLTAQLDKSEIFHDRWLRTAGDLAVKMKITFPKSTERYGVQIDEGTEGLLFVDGKFRKSLDPGYHDVVGKVKRIKEAFKLSEEGGKRVEALIVPKGQVSFLVALEALPLSDGSTVGASARVTVTLEDADKFYTELMLEYERFGSQEFAASMLGGHLGDALRDTLVGQTPQTLLSSIPQYGAWQTGIKVSLNNFASRYGLKVQQVHLNGFDSPVLTQLRANAGVIEDERQKHAFQEALDQLSSENSFKSLKSEMEYKELESQLTHQYSLKDSERQLIRQRFLRDSGHEDRMKMLSQTQEYQNAESTGLLTQNQLDHQVRIGVVRYENIEEGEKVDGEIERRNKRHEQEMKEAEEASALSQKNLAAILKIKAEKKAAQVENRIRLGQGLHGVDNTAKAAAMDESVQGAMKIESDRDIAIAQAQAQQAQAQMHIVNQGRGNAIPSGVTTSLPFNNPYGAGAGNLTSQQSSAGLDSAIGCLRLVTSSSTEYLGTAWMISESHAITCAHVGEKLRHHILNGGAAGYLCFTVNGASHQVPIEAPILHSKWGNEGLKLNPNNGATGEIPPYDLAIIPLNEPRSQTLALAAGDGFSNGQAVRYVGFSVEGQANVKNAHTLTSYTAQGVISSLTDWWANGKPAEYADIVRINEPVVGGISGSPLLNEHGQVIGVMTAGSFKNIRGERVSDGMGGYAIHIRHLRHFYQQWKEEEERKNR